MNHFLMDYDNLLVPLERDHPQGGMMTLYPASQTGY